MVVVPRPALALMCLALLALPALAGGPPPAAPAEPQVWQPIQTLHHKTVEWNGLAGPLIASDGKNLGVLTAEKHGPEGNAAFVLAVYRPGGSGRWDLASDVPVQGGTPAGWTGDGTLSIETNSAIVAASAGDGSSNHLATWLDFGDLSRPVQHSFGDGSTGPGFAGGAAQDGITMAVADSTRGKIHVYRVDGAGSGELQVLTDPGNRSSGLFGQGLAMSGRFLAVADPGSLGTRGTIGSGVVYIYEADSSGRYQLLQQVPSPAPKLGGHFGKLLHMEGNLLAVMEPNESTSAAIVYLFRNTGTWDLEARVGVPRGTGATTVIMDLDGETLIAGTSDNRAVSTVRIWHSSEAAQPGAAWTLLAEAPISILSAAPHDLVLLPDGWAAVSEPTPGDLAIDIFGKLPVPAAECPGCLHGDTESRIVEALPDGPAAELACVGRNATIPRPERGSDPAVLQGAPTANLAACVPLDLHITPTLPVTVSLPHAVTLTYATNVVADLVAQAQVTTDPAQLQQQVTALPGASLYLEVEAAPGQSPLPTDSTVTIEMKAPDASQEFAIHYWDGAQWIDLAAAGAGATISGKDGGRDLHVYATGFDSNTGTAWARVDHTSIYALAPRHAPSESSAAPLILGLVASAALLALLVGAVALFVVRRR